MVWALFSSIVFGCEKNPVLDFCSVSFFFLAILAYFWFIFLSFWLIFRSWAHSGSAGGQLFHHKNGLDHQSTPKNEKLAKMREKCTKQYPKMAPKTNPRLKKSSKSWVFSQPKTMLENRAQTMRKTQKMNSNKSSKNEQSYSIQSRLGGLREALTINEIDAYSWTANLTTLPSHVFWYWYHTVECHFHVFG